MEACMTLAVILLFSATSVFAAQPPRFYRLDEVTTSPLQNVIVENYRLDEDQLNAQQKEKVRSDIMEGQLWLSDAAQRTRRQLLMEYNGSHMNARSILFSPDQRWLLINEHFLSDHASIIIEKRVDQLRYEALNFDPDEKLWPLFDRSMEIKRKQDASPAKPLSAQLDHMYAEGRCWSSDSTAFLVALYGQISGKLQVEDWYCVFDVKSLKPTLDLNVMNRNACRPVK